MNSGTYVSGSKKTSTAVITVDYDFEKFEDVYVGGKKLTQGTHYKVSKGSAVITFYASYLETLEAGNSYDVLIRFSDTDITTKLTIIEDETGGTSAASTDTGSSDGTDSESGTGVTAAETYDRSDPLLWTMIIAAAAAAAAAITYKYKKNRR